MYVAFSMERVSIVAPLVNSYTVFVAILTPFMARQIERLTPHKLAGAALWSRDFCGVAREGLGEMKDKWRIERLNAILYPKKKIHRPSSIYFPTPPTVKDRTVSFSSLLMPMSSVLLSLL